VGDLALLGDPGERGFEEDVQLGELGNALGLSSLKARIRGRPLIASPGCGSACNRDPLSGVIGVEQGPLIPTV